MNLHSRTATRLAILAAALSLGAMTRAQTVWTGVNNVSATTNWSDTANWSTAASPAGTDVLFGELAAVGAAGTINSVMDTAMAINSLTFTNSNGQFHTLLIPAGTDLTVGGTTVVGGQTANTYTTIANVTGGGSLLMNGNLTVGNNGASAANQGSALDLSGLSNFSFAGTTLTLGSGNRSSANLRLAGSSNYISATTLNANTPSSSSSVTGFLTLGGGTNVLNVTTINIAANRGNCTVAYSNVTGGLLVRGLGGTDADRANMVIGLRSASGSGGSTTGNLFLSDHPVDMKLGTVTVGQANNGGATGANTGTGVIQFNTGTIDATTINMAVASANASFSIGNGTVTVGTNATLGQKALLLVGNVSLVNLSAGSAATGNLNVSGGDVVCSGSIVKTTAAGTGNVLVNGGALSVSNTIGSASTPLNAFNLTNATLTLAAAGTATANVTALNCGGTTNKINITAVPSVTGYPASIPLIKYAGTLGGTFNIGLGTLPVSALAYAGYISNNTVNGSIDLVVTSGPTPLRTLAWNGNLNSDWDIGTTANWKNNGIGGATYSDADFTVFDDSASGTTTVNLTTILASSSVTVSNISKTYGFTGSGYLTGAGGLTKKGAGTLYITNSGVNDFTGTINIEAGTVRVGDGSFSGNLGSGAIANNGALAFNRGDAVTVANAISGAGTLTKQGSGTLTLSSASTYTGATFVNSGTLSTLNNAALGATNGATTVSSGASLDVNARNLGAEPVLVSGTGDGGNGAIVNSGAQALNALRYVTLLGNTTVGGAGRWDIRAAPSTADPSLAGLSTGGNAYKLTKIGANQISLVGVTVDPAFGDIEVQGGILGVEAATTGLGDPTKALTVQAGAALQLFQLTNQLNKIISLASDGLAPSLINNSGANTVVGPITLTTDCIFNINGTSLNIAGNLSGGLLTKQGTGNLIVSSNVTHAGTVAHVGTFTLNGTHSGGVTNTSTFATFAGSGTNNGFSDISGNLLPGSTNAIGTLTLGGLALQFGAVVGFELNSTTNIGGAVNDLIVVNGDLTVSGNTIMINPVGLLQIGKPYRLFNYTGVLVENAPFFAPNVGAYSFTVDTTTPGQVNLIVSGGGPVWNGGSITGNNWSDAANWNGVALNPNDTLNFIGVARLNNTNDTTADTTYTDIVFNNGAGAFKLNGNSITLAGNVLNASANPQTINLGMSFNTTPRTMNGGSGGLIVGGGVTNMANLTTLTLSGTGTLTNLLASADPNSMTNVLSTTTNANWTIMDNVFTAAVTVPWNFQIAAGTLNFGSGASAPTLTSTTARGAPGDNSLGQTAGASATLNINNGILTLSARLNTGTAGGATGIVNVVNGTLNVDDQFQGANGAATSVSTVNVSGGTFNVGGTTPGTAADPLYVASRGPGSLTVSGSGALNCGILDVSRSINASIPGVVHLNGGTITCTRVGTATANAGAATTGSTATFNFNGGTLKARSSQGGFIQGSTAAPIIPVVCIVKSGGAIIDSAGFNVTAVEALQHDSSLGGTPDGGLAKNGAGALTLSAANTYTGPTVVNNGTLLVNGSIGTTVSVETGGTLGGTGSISNNVTVKSGGTITAGAAGAVGNLTVAGNVTMQAGATAFMELNKTAASSDQLRAIAGTATTITYAGTLSLNNLAGTLAAGDSFKLFSATNYAGSFSAITPATPGAGLLWVTSVLNTSGTISVALAPIPRIVGFGVVGGNLVLSGTNGPANATYWVLTTTDVSQPLANWTPVHTNTFTAGGNFSYTNGAPTAPQRFYTILVP